MKTLLLLHGAIGSSEQLQPLAQQLSAYYDVHVLDFPGHGGTTLPESFSIPLFAEYVLDYLTLKQLAAVSIFGYSMGGYVAAWLALHHPDRIAQVITLATKFHWTETIASAEVKMLQPEVIEQKLPAFAKTLAQRHAPHDWKSLLSKTADMLIGMGRQPVLQPEDFQQITIPFQVMLGDRDKMVTLGETAAVYKQLPKGRLAILPGTGHPIEATDNSLLVFHLRHFLDN